MVPRAMFSIASLSDSTESEREGGERKRGREEEGGRGKGQRKWSSVSGYL